MVFLWEEIVTCKTLNLGKIFPKTFIKFHSFTSSMAGEKKKKTDPRKNKRLDIFLEKLEIEKEKKEQIINFVEDLTLGVLKDKSKPRLRLNKPES